MSFFCLYILFIFIFLRAVSSQDCISDPSAQSLFDDAISFIPFSMLSNMGQWEVGTEIKINRNGYITGLQIYKKSGMRIESGGHLWNGTSGQLIDEIALTGTSQAYQGWLKACFETPIRVMENDIVVPAYRAKTIIDALVGLNIRRQYMDSLPAQNYLAQPPAADLSLGFSMGRVRSSTSTSSNANVYPDLPADRWYGADIIFVADPPVTLSPTLVPSSEPTKSPSSPPTEAPTMLPSRLPTRSPSRSPSETPTNAPAAGVTNPATEQPSQLPTANPTVQPTRRPTQLTPDVVAPTTTAESHANTTLTSLPTTSTTGVANVNTVDIKTEASDERGGDNLILILAAASAAFLLCIVCLLVCLVVQRRRSAQELVSNARKSSGHRRSHHSRSGSAQSRASQARASRAMSGRASRGRFSHYRDLSMSPILPRTSSAINSRAVLGGGEYVPASKLLLSGAGEGEEVGSGTYTNVPDRYGPIQLASTVSPSSSSSTLQSITGHYGPAPPKPPSSHEGVYELVTLSRSVIDPVASTPTETLSEVQYANFNTELRRNEE